MNSILVVVLLLISSGLAQAKTLVVLGDSLTEGYGVAKDKAFPAILEQKIAGKKTKAKWKVINAGVSGSTTASGPKRMAWQMKSFPDLVIIALGANDGLRGLKIEEMKKNLSDTIEVALKEKNTTVILAGMEVPPNYGKDYRIQFHDAFPELAAKYNIRLVPFLLDKVAGIKELNQTDSTHPNEKGHQIIADTLLKFIENLL